MTRTPYYCSIHEHRKWCEHNGGVMGETGWERPKLVMPMLHLNGSDGQVLLKQYEAAAASVWLALRAVEEHGPNGRDYYLLGVGEWEKAKEQHVDRILDLRMVYDDLNEIIEHISDELSTRRK